MHESIVIGRLIKLAKASEVVFIITILYKHLQ